MRATNESKAAAPATTTPFKNSTELKPLPNLITTPFKPPSRTIKLDPTPIGKSDVLSGNFDKKFIKSFKSAGWKKNSAGPPTFNQVRSESFWFSVNLPRVLGKSITILKPIM